MSAKVTRAADFLGNVQELLGIHDEVNYMFNFFFGTELFFENDLDIEQNRLHVAFLEAKIERVWFSEASKKTCGLSKTGPYKLELYSCGHLGSMNFLYWVL